MIAIPEEEYDDGAIYEYPEVGWKRFCCGVLVRTMENIKLLCGDLRRRGYYAMIPDSCKELEERRCQAISYAWVFSGQPSLLGFEETCITCGCDPRLVRQRLQSVAECGRDINRLVDYLIRAGRMADVRYSRKPTGFDCLGTGIAAAVEAVRSERRRAEGGDCDRPAQGDGCPNGYARRRRFSGTARRRSAYGRRRRSV